MVNRNQDTNGNPIKAAEKFAFPVIYQYKNKKYCNGAMNLLKLKMK